MQNNYKAGWSSPSNIALIKYWGKHPGQIPRNPSISMSLSASFTECRIKATPRLGGDEQVLFNLYFHEQPASETFRSRLTSYFNSIISEFNFLTEYHFHIRTKNSFPHSSGIASSASAMSALALCLCSLDEKINARKRKDDFFQQASYYARIGSGSAARSVFPAYSIWGACDSFSASSNNYASPLEVHPAFRQWADAILIVDSSRKSVSSSEGHERMNRHYYLQGRQVQALAHTAELLSILKSGDVNGFVRVVESEALSLHGLMMSSEPSIILLREESLSLVQAIQHFRNKTGIPVCFTIDAGPNIHLLYPLAEKELVQAFIKEELLAYCEGESWIDDSIGSGPLELE